MISEAFFVLREESQYKKLCYFISIFWGRVALNLTWVLPSKTSDGKAVEGIEESVERVTLQLLLKDVR